MGVRSDRDRLRHCIMLFLLRMTPGEDWEWVGFGIEHPFIQRYNVRFSEQEVKVFQPEGRNQHFFVRKALNIRFCEEKATTRT